MTTSVIEGLPPRYPMTKEAGSFLGLSPRTFEKHRVYGTGPVYRKLGGRVSMPSPISKPGPTSACGNQPLNRATRSFRH